MNASTSALPLWLNAFGNLVPIVIDPVAARHSGSFFTPWTVCHFDIVGMAIPHTIGLIFSLPFAAIEGIHDERVRECI